MTAAPRVQALTDVEVIHQYRVRCPQCGDHPDSPFASLVSAVTARRRHWLDVHRDDAKDWAAAHRDPTT